MPKIEKLPRRRWAIYAGSYNYWQEVHPRHLTNDEAPQMGGSESTALTIATRLARSGEHVLFGCKTKAIDRTTYPSGGDLVLCPAELFISAIFVEGYDVLAAWDAENLFRYNFEHVPVNIVCFQLNHSENPLYAHVVDKFFHPSRWHAERFATVFDVPEDKQVPLMTNATEPRWFDDAWNPGGGLARRAKGAGRVIWASSPDRGLHHLLRVWPRVVEEHENASLDIYYDMDKWLKVAETATQQGRQLATADRAQEVRQLLRGLSSDPEMSVDYHGGVGKQEVIKAYLDSKLLAYPCDPVAPTEGFSMTCLEAWAAGCQLVISDADALPELWGKMAGVTVLPLPIDDDLLVHSVVNALDEPTHHGPREVPDRLTYDNLVHLWKVEVDRCLQKKSNH